MLNNKEKKLIFTLENSLKDFEKKGNLDLALDYYNPNNFFEKVYFISYNPEDIMIEHNKKWLEVISPIYFSFLHKIKRFKILFLLILPFVYIIHVLNLIWLIKKEKIHMSRTGHPYLMSLSLLVASKLCRIPFVSTIGGDNRLAQEKIGRYHIFNNKFLSFFLEEFTLNKSDVVIVPNEYSANYVKSISTQNNIAVIPLPLRDEIFKNLDKNLRIENPNNFLFIGRFVGDKHPDFVLELYIQYLKNNPDSSMNLTMIGNGELESILKERVKKAGLENRVLFTGFLNTEGITKYLEANPICLIPISGFVIYEASVFGNIIVTSDIEWHSEFIEDNKNGWVGKYLDIEDWLRKIDNIMSDLEHSRKKALILREKIKLLSPSNIYDNQLEVYKKLFDDKL
ncbi:glycosyltransferase [bacterium]|nr:glycosyltransferase [bacterium]MBU1957077.1 glycosyltransferase [bacterium]